MAEQVTLIGQLKDLVNFPINLANGLLSSFHPYEVGILALFSILTGYFLKQRYKAGNAEFIFFSLIIFFALKGIGIVG